MQNILPAHGISDLPMGNGPGLQHHNGLNHPVDLEIENVYWVPFSSMNVLGVITRRQGTHAWCMGCRWFRCDNA